MDKLGKMISAAKVAEIWNERAKSEFGIDANYSRHSVRGRREDLDGVETELGWLYSEEKAREMSLRPRIVKRPDMAERNRGWIKSGKNRRVSGQSENS